jgi:CheY-like chemotaxis protein
LPQNFTPQKATRRPVMQRTEAPAAPPARPQTLEESSPAAAALANAAMALPNEVGDDRDSIQSDDRVLLIVDNDLDFASIVLEAARKAGFKGLVTASGAAALALAGDYLPHAITLDISLPDIDGWRVLKRLKHDLNLRHIPVYIMSTIDQPERGLRLGARGVLPKPIQTADMLEGFLVEMQRHASRQERRAVVIEPDANRRRQIAELLQGPGVTVTAAETAAAGLAALRDGPVDCAVIAPHLPDSTLAALASELMAEPSLYGCPRLVYSSPLAEEETSRLKRLAHEFDLRHLDSLEQLAEQSSLALCRPLAKLPERHRQMIQQLSDPTAVLAGKKVLIVDDDIRNIFALTSVLERYDMVTVSAETGRDAINLLQAAQDVDIVLMDIMMPEMDGIDTMRAIRQISRFKKLPIVAVTAKAMKGDREKCIEAGAWDYLAKPVDPDQMLAVLRAWLAE